MGERRWIVTRLSVVSVCLALAGACSAEGLRWTKLPANAQVKACYVLGPLPATVEAKAVFAFLKKPDWRKRAFEGTKPSRLLAKDGVFTNAIPRTKAFYVFYVRARKPAKAILSVDIKSWRTKNECKVYLDYKSIVPDTQQAITRSKHTVIVEYYHERSYQGNSVAIRVVGRDILLGL